MLTALVVTGDENDGGSGRFDKEKSRLAWHLNVQKDQVWL
jgi:hypothetical protein